MICPYCDHDNDKVIDSRASDSGAAIRRRRECVACGKRFTTYERVVRTARLMVVKKDGSRVPFERENIQRGVWAACGKRPIPEDVKEDLVAAVDDEVHREFEREVPSAEIGQRVIARLRDLDEIAYIRYASEHYNFRSIDDFATELSDLKSRPRSLPNQAELFGAGADGAKR